jgi:Ca2+-binding EF-hand superfamily protein
LDSQKKNFLTLQDIKNKLQVFNFYTKMHIDVKKFINDNFLNGIDAFKFFVGKKINLEKNLPNYMSEEEALKSHITLKEFFDAFKIFFPNKYANNTILKYLNKYFNISLASGIGKTDLMNKKEIINFSEFNYIYFDKVEKDETFINKRGNDTKLMTNRSDIEKQLNKLSKKKSEDNFYYSNLFKKKFDTLVTPFDNDALLKLKRILSSSKYDLNSFFETVSLKCPNDDFIVNKFQFKHIIKELNLGLTNIEIDQIFQKIEKVSYDGNINLKNFVKTLFNQNPILQQGKKNIAQLIEEIKSLIYKFYSNPIICFQNNDTNHKGKIDFEQFKNIIYDMYHRNEQQFPNFTQIKNAFDACDLRKDGIIDINEWCKAFASYNGKLDPNPENSSNGLEFFDKKFKTSNNFKLKNKTEHNRKVLRDWETSGDISNIYKFINRNRKYIKNKIINGNMFIKSNSGDCIHQDNLLKVLQDLMPNMLLSKTQWKMIVNIGKSKKFESLIDINEFFRLIEITAMNLNSHPSINSFNKNKVYKISNSVRNYKYYVNTESNRMSNNSLCASYNGFTPQAMRKNRRIFSINLKNKENELVKTEN